MKVINYNVNNQTTQVSTTNANASSSDNIQNQGGKGNAGMPQTLSSLSQGDIFEGTISRDSSGRITIHLGNGESVTARMETTVNLLENTATFFEVKSNDQGQLALRALSQDANANPTIIRALEQAGVAIDKANLSLVQEMMRMQLPIDAKSLANMVKLAYANKTVDASTLVQLTKLGLPVTADNVEQFKQYMAGDGNLVKNLDQMMKQLPEALQQAVDSGADGYEVLQQLSEAFTDKTFSAVNGQYAENVNQIAQGETTVGQSDTIVSQNAQTQIENGQNTMNIIDNAQTQIENGQQVMNISQNAQKLSGTVRDDQIINTNSNSSEIIGHQMQTAEDNVQTKSVTEKVFQLNQQIQTGETTAKEALTELTKELTQNKLAATEYKELFSSKAFKELLGKMMEQEWLLKPDEVADNGKVKAVYERMQQQFDRLENLVQKLGQGEQFLHGVKDVKSNVQFMNDMSQLFNYVQIPLKMANQNAKGDLYVYTDKRALRQGKEELTAHLHLELEHLGITDVYVHLKQKKLATNFVMEKEESLDLVMEHIDVLTARLQEKGYDITIHGETTADGATPPAFMEEILTKELPNVAIKRYSLDVCV